MKNVSELNKLRVQLFIEAVLNEGRLDLIDELIAADFVGHIPCAGPEVTGPAGVRQLVSSHRHAHPGLHIKIEDQIAEEDRVVTRWHAPESRSSGCWPESKSIPTPNAPACPPARRWRTCQSVSYTHLTLPTKA